LEAYKYLSKAYDVLMADVDYKMWIGYLDSFLKKAGAHYIYEPACGTGKSTVEFYRLGYDITASDISPEMLSIAADDARKKGMSIRYVIQDMRSFEVGNKADAVVSVCDGPNYLEEQGLESFAVSAYKALKNNGILLFDMSTREKFIRMDGQVYYDDGENASCIWKNAYYTDKGFLEMDVTLFIKKGDLYERFTERHIQYAYSAGKVLETVLSAGFKSAYAYKFLTTEKFDSGSERVQFICYK
jgi:SAM-dependent methyltransferase